MWGVPHHEELEDEQRRDDLPVHRHPQLRARRTQQLSEAQEKHMALQFFGNTGVHHGRVLAEHSKTEMTSMTLLLHC